MRKDYGFPYAQNTRWDPRLNGLQGSQNSFSAEVSSPRADMFSNNLQQAMLVSGAEFPQIFSGCENNLGDYSINKSRRNQDVIVMEVIQHHPPTIHNFFQQFTVIYRGVEDGKIGYFVIEPYTKCSDGFGYINTPKNLGVLVEGAYIPKEKILQTTPAHKDGGYCLGLNANVVYTSDEGVIEDAITVSQALVDRLDTPELHRQTINIPASDCPILLYGDEFDRKIIPDIGETISEDGILGAWRSITPDTFLADMMPSELERVQPMHDRVFYANPNATIIDINIQMVNVTSAPKSLYSQFDKYITASNVYHERIVSFYLKHRAEYRNRLTKDFNTLVTTSIKQCAVAGIRFKDLPHRSKVKLTGRNNKEVNFARLTVTYMSTRKCSLGFKTTGRYGDKGVICQVVPTEEMPIDEEGFRADFRIDFGSNIARMNPAQLYEQAIGRTAEFVRRKVEQIARSSYERAYETLIDFYNDINPQYAAICATQVHPTPEQRKNHVQDAIRDMVRLNITPGLDTIKPSLLPYLKKKWNVTTSPITYTKRDSMGEVIGTFTTKHPICIGPKYIYLLCKIPDPSSPGFANISQYGTPMKTPGGMKRNHPIRYGANRFGEDETRIMMVDLNDPETLVRLMGLQSSSPKGVDALVSKLLESKHPTQIRRIDMSTEELVRSNTVIGLFGHFMSNTGINMRETKISDADLKTLRSHEPYRSEQEQ